MPALCRANVDERITERVRNVMRKINRNDRNDRNDDDDNSRIASSPPLPYHHFFSYRGVECGLIRCILLNSSWVGFVREPKRQRRVWPPRATSLPFEVGIDFVIDDEDADDDDDNNSFVLVGFHVMHLIHDTSLPGVPQREISVDYLAKQLRQYIDMTSVH